jgi:hypothetical protein
MWKDTPQSRGTLSRSKSREIQNNNISRGPSRGFTSCYFSCYLIIPRRNICTSQLAFSLYYNLMRLLKSRLFGTMTVVMHFKHLNENVAIFQIEFPDKKYIFFLVPSSLLISLFFFLQL